MCEFDKLDNDTTITIISINYVCVYGCIYCLKQKIHVRTPCAPTINLELSKNSLTRRPLGVNSGCLGLCM